MRLGIFGVGALGCLFAARLAPYADVTLFGHWAAQIKHLNEQGLVVSELDGGQTYHPLRASTDRALLFGIDTALVLVKSQQTAASAKEIASVLRPDGLVITLQNGLGNRAKLARYFADNQIIVGTTSQGANIPKMGHLVHAGNGMTHIEQHEKGAGLAALFERAGIPIQVNADVAQVIWGKLTANAGINPLTALLGWRNGELNMDDRAREMMCAAAEETVVVAQALDVTLPYLSASEAICDIANATAANRSSMLQDVSRGAKTEIEAISGEIVRLGEDVGVSVQTNLFLRDMVLAGERRGWSFWAIDDLYRQWLDNRIS